MAADAVKVIVEQVRVEVSQKRTDYVTRRCCCIAEMVND